MHPERSHSSSAEPRVLFSLRIENFWTRDELADYSDVVRRGCIFTGSNTAATT